MIVRVLLLLLPLAKCFLVDSHLKSNVIQHDHSPSTEIVREREIQQENCPIMEVISNCRQYFFAIWDTNGNFVWDSFLTGIEYAECYEPSKCYLIELVSESGVCDYRVMLDGEVGYQGTASYNTDSSGEVFYVGDGCKKNCPGQTELVFITYVGFGDLDYTVYIADDGEYKGFVPEGDAAYFCIDLNKCNTIYRPPGDAYYYVLDGDTSEYIDGGPYDSYHTFGDCNTGCASSENAILVVAETQVNLTIIKDGIILSETALAPGESSGFVCLDYSICTVFETEGKATYYFFRDDEAYDKGTNSDFKGFGECEMLCDSKPILSSTKRGEEIVSILSTISGMSAIADFNQFQYQAACWLIYDDLRQLNASDTNIFQRYILTLFYLYTNGKYWLRKVGFMTGKHECSWEGVTCNDEEIVTELIYGEMNVTGPFPPEFTSLLSLESFYSVFNRLKGTIPAGIRRLENLKEFVLDGNELTGTVPNDFLEIYGLFKISLKNNLFSGTLPTLVNNVSTINECSFQDNLFSGTLPSWIVEADQLERIYLQANRFTGTLPEGLLASPSLQVMHIHKNQLTGTLPSNLFLGESIRELRIEENRFTGTIPIDIPLNNSISILSMQNNLLTGQIPSELASLEKAQQLLISNNLLTGTFPSEVVVLQKLGELRIENNNITGTIPFEDCDQFSTLSADCSVPHNIDCICCTRCFGMFTAFEDILPCPSAELKLTYKTNVNSRLFFYVENEARQLIDEDFVNARKVNMEFSSCISPTDCFSIESSSDVSMDIAVNGIPVIEDAPKELQRKFGFSSTGVIELDKCDDFLVCDKVLKSKSPERILFNLVTRFEGVDIFSSNSSVQYEALCWWLNDIGKLSEREQMNTILLQRFILAVLYLTTEGSEWKVQTNWLTDSSHCTWYGISCDEYPGVISKIDLSNNNLVGILPKEIGELRGLVYLNLSYNDFARTIPKEIVNLSRLQSLNLSNNRLEGTIHGEIKFLKQLNQLDLSSNRLSGSIPSTIGNLVDLEYMNFTGNALSADVPETVGNMQKLQTLSLSMNLLNGELVMLENLTNLVDIEAAENYFTGRLPIFGDSQRNLKRLYLNNNQFSGGIPSDIAKLTSVEEFVLSANSVTGSLPSELGNMQQVSTLALSYNLLKGTIPPILRNLRSLKLLHLHSNALDGYADYFDYPIESYITDCGNTEIAAATVICSQCTKCCNIDGFCITGTKTWPRGALYDIQISSALFVILLAMMFGAVFTILAVVLTRLGPKLPSLPFDVRKDFNEGSVFRFFLTQNKISWVVATIAVLFELWVIYVFLEAGDISDKGNLWLYSESCPEDSLECQDYSITTFWGWITFAAILATFLLPDLLNGALLFYENVEDYNLQGMVTGIILISITVLSIVASTIFIYATSISNIAIIKEAVIVLFLNSIDEQFYLIVQRVAPGWVETIEAEIIEYSISRTVKEISEIIDDDDSFDDEGNQMMSKGFNAEDLYRADVDFGKEDYKPDNITKTLQSTALSKDSLTSKFSRVDSPERIDLVEMQKEFKRLENLCLEEIRELKGNEVKALEDLLKTELKELKKSNEELKLKLETRDAAKN